MESGTTKGFPNPGSFVGISGAGAGVLAEATEAAAASRAANAAVAAGLGVNPSGLVVSSGSTSAAVPSSLS